MTQREAQKFFLACWDMMVKKYNERPVLMSAFTTYRTAAEKAFFHLYNMDMALCSEVSRGYDPEGNKEI
jgi:hypothetical protein